MLLWTVLLPISVTPSFVDEEYWEYSESRARRALNMAAAAYADEPVFCVEKTYPNKHYHIVVKEELLCDTTNNLCSVFVAISSIDKQIIVSFRGTTSGKQLKREFFDSLKPSIDVYGYGLVDLYFYHAIISMWSTIEPVLKQWSSEEYHVLFTGHSLGGALATLASMMTYALMIRSPERIHLYTFGEPRVGNQIFSANVDRFITDSWRIVHAADLIPHLPPCRDSEHDHNGCSRRDLRRSYHHATEVWYPNGMKPGSNYKICTKDDEDPNCSNGLGKYHTYDHYYYFEHMVSEYGMNGCVDRSSSTDRYKLVTILILIMFYIAKS